MSRILVVDDDVMIRKWVRAVLEKGNHSCDEAKDGKEAIESLKNNKYDLVLLDICMPNMDGDELLNYMDIHKDSLWPPIIVLSGYLTETTRRSAVKILLEKPIAPDKLLQDIDKVLSGEV